MRVHVAPIHLLKGWLVLQHARQHVELLRVAPWWPVTSLLLLMLPLQPQCLLSSKPGHGRSRFGERGSAAHSIVGCNDLHQLLLRSWDLVQRVVLGFELNNAPFPPCIFPVLLPSAACAILQQRALHCRPVAGSSEVVSCRSMQSLR